MTNEEVLSAITKIIATELTNRIDPTQDLDFVKNHKAEFIELKNLINILLPKKEVKNFILPEGYHILLETETFKLYASDEENQPYYTDNIKELAYFVCDHITEDKYFCIHEHILQYGLRKI